MTEHCRDCGITRPMITGTIHFLIRATPAFPTPAADETLKAACEIWVAAARETEGL